MMIVPLVRERWGRGFAFSMNGMNVPNWINVLVYMVTAQSRHGIVIFNNQVHCLQRGDGRMEILDKRALCIVWGDIQNKNYHLCAKRGLRFHVLGLGLTKPGVCVCSLEV